MDSAWQELIRAAPWGAVILVLRWLEMKEKKEERGERDAERTERDNNAKERAQAERESQQYIAKVYADAINTLAKSVADGTMRTEKAIVEMKESVLEQYKKMGITQELIDFKESRDKP